MNRSTLFARCLDGSILEIGELRAQETAARLRNALERELGEEYLAFWIVDDEEPTATTCRGLRYDELRPPADPRARAARH